MPRFGVSHTDRPVLAAGRVNYHGEPVAAVVAETLDAAQAAARAVRVDYRELPGVYTLDAALAPGAHLVQDPSIRPGDPKADTNVLEDALYTWGDVAAEEARTAVVVEHVYTFPMVTHFPIEPGGTVVVPTDQGGLDVYSPVQHPYLLQRTIASVLGLPLNQVRVFAPAPGGGFRGQADPEAGAAPGLPRAAHPADLPAGAVAGGDLPEHAAGRLPDHGAHRGHGERRAPLLPGRRRLPDRRLRRRRPPRDGQGQLCRGRPLPDPGGTDRGPRGHDQHDAEHGLPGVRQSPGGVGDRVAAGRRRPAARPRRPGDPP